MSGYEDNRYQCDICKKHVEFAIIEHKPIYLPPHLTITLCRYEYKIDTQETYKITNYVEIPLSFKISSILGN